MQIKTSQFSEAELEDHIVNAMQSNGYTIGDPKDFDKQYAIDTAQFWQFLQTSQQDELDKIIKYNPNDWQSLILNVLDRLIKKNGILEVLKKGIGVNDAHLNFLYPIPLASSSQKVIDNYQQNQFSITRQVHYSVADPLNSVDMVLFINGLAIATFELKSTHKNQTARFNALKQYQNDRDPKETLFNFARCIVHFALDNQEIYMTTRLAGDKTFFLPFNKGYNGGSGNPPNPQGFKTAYLWQEVLTQDSLVNLISHFVRLGCDDPDIKKSKLNDKTLFFPRYHQMNVVRRLIDDVQDNGVGKRYLIQHSAGSGKSNSITWLAYQLIEAYPNVTHDTDTSLVKPIVDTVIVVTDRRILDKQLKDNINQFSEIKGIIAHANKSKDLRDALENGKKIVITTIQKFPYILDGISEMADKHFAIIIDEAHSSQSGVAHDGMNRVLGAKDDNDDYISEDNQTIHPQDKVIQAIESRKMRGNASYFAFTATPKGTTLEKFGIKQDDGSFKVFDLYSMKQAIQEGFILDVLNNYTTLRSYYEIKKSISDDPRFNSIKAQKILRAYAEGEQRTIDVKAEIILEHFMESVYGVRRLKGQAKGMVVTQNIEMAIRYHKTISQQLDIMGNPFKTVIAFSGEKEVDGIPYTEKVINGFDDSKTKDEFDKSEYRLLIVANKYLTGFDQPKLTAMYVDKKLQDVQAVQALSRLNRSAPKLGKRTEDLFVLDFYNEIEEIKASFDKYYTATTLSKETNVNVLHEIKSNLDGVGVYELAEVIDYADQYFSGASMDILEAKIDMFAERFNHTLELIDDDKIEFKMQAKQFVKIYSRIAAITPFQVVAWEQLYWLLKALIPKLVVRFSEEVVFDELLESVDLSTYAMERTAVSKKIDLKDDAGELEPTDSNPFGVHDDDPQEQLEKIIKDFNERWFKNWDITPEEQRVKFVSLAKRLIERSDFKHKYVDTNDAQHKKLEFESMVKDIVVADRRKELDFYKQFIQDEAFQTAVIHSLRHVVDSGLFKDS